MAMSGSYAALTTQIPATCAGCTLEWDCPPVLLDAEVTAPLVDKLLTAVHEPEDEDGTANVPLTPLAMPVEIFAELGATGIPVDPPVAATVTAPDVLELIVGI